MNDPFAIIPPTPPSTSPGPPPASPGERWNPKTISWWHEAFADWMLSNPDKPLKDAAKFFNCSINYLYLLKNSDSFQVYWRQRRKEFEGALIEGSVDLVGQLKDKIGALAEVSIDALQARVERATLVGPDADKIPSTFLLQTADMALKKLGYGIPELPPAPTGSVGAINTQVNVTVSSEVLEEARKKLLALHNVQTVNMPGDG